MARPKGITFWKRSPRSRAQIVRRVCEALEAEYGRPRLGNPRRPLDDLFYIIISNRTAPSVATTTFRALKRRYPRWGLLASARQREVAKVLRPAGLSAKKAAQMRGIAKRLIADFGGCTLAPLARTSDEQALGYLRSLPGVSTKVGQCVMMYTLGRQVLPVDVHVHRVAGRIGWVNRKRADQCHDIMARIVPPRRRCSFHVDCIVHGRKVCTPRSPKCTACPIRKHCEFAGGC